jgi:membrane protein involved in colicin uptake
MNSVFKKIAIYSIIGILQFGFGLSVIEASPMHKDLPNPRYMLQQDQHEQERMKKDKHERERMEKERQERERIERERHEREMKWRQRESERDWHERQERENQRHDDTMNEFEAGILGLILGSLIK